MQLEPQVGRLAPVPDRFRFGPSDGAKRLDFLRMLADELDHFPKWKKLPPDYDVQCYRAALSLRCHAAYLIESGVRCV